MASHSSAAQIDVSIGWGAAVLCGLLWGLATALTDALVQPTSVPPVAFLLSIGSGWGLMGLCWSIGSKLAEPRVTPAVLAALAVVGAVVISFVQVPPTGAVGWFASSRLLGLADSMQLPGDALFAHVLWFNLFYGGLYVTGYAASRRALRSRARFERLRRSLEEDDARLDEVRLDLMRGRIQPPVMLAAIAELKARYDAGAAGADRLLDRLVAFLRAAMDRGGRGGETLPAELGLAEAYVGLRRELTGGSAGWRADLRAAPPPIRPPKRPLLPFLVELGRSAEYVALETDLSGRLYSIVVTAKGARDAEFDEDSPADASRRLAVQAEESGWTVTDKRERDTRAWIISTRVPTPLEDLAAQPERIAN